MLVARATQVARVYSNGASEAVPALTDVSFEIHGSEMVGLVGPSGCGKSTLLNLFGCVDIPTSGTIEINGLQTQKLSDDDLTRIRRDWLGSVFQLFNLLAAMTVSENVAFPLVLQGIPRGEAARRVREALEDVGMIEKADAFPSQLSGGQMQRVAIARALVHNPALLLADEPTGNLDSTNGNNVLQLLRSSADRGQAILMATHSEEAAALCDRVIRMRDGRISGYSSRFENGNA